jgi:hypothetical protein
MNAKQLVRGLLAVLALAGFTSASALPTINGSISFSDGFDSTGTDTYVVSGLTAIDVGGQALAQGCTGDFPPPNCFVIGNYAFDFDISTLGGQMVFDYDGFEFHVTSFGAPTRNGLTCDTNFQCQDSLIFNASGYVIAPGFDATVFTMIWTGNGVCTDKQTANHCDDNSVSASWSASAVATGVPSFQVPEPGTLALIGAALTLLAFVVRVRRR